MNMFIFTIFHFLKSTFKITDGIDGSALSYTLTYADNNNSDIVCGSATIPASSCNFGTCKYAFPSLSVCSASNIYNMSVFATNLLGNGHASSTITALSKCTIQCLDCKQLLIYMHIYA